MSNDPSSDDRARRDAAPDGAADNARFWREEIDRRKFVKRSILSTFGVAGGATLLAACGGDDSTAEAPPNGRA